MALTHDDVLTILKIIDESQYDEVRVEIGDLKLHVRRRGDAEHEPFAPAERWVAATAVASAAPAPRTPREEPIPEGLVAVRAPMLGTFYRAPASGERPFVEVGDRVRPEDTVCLVEVMKLFHSVKAGAAGAVVKILVENGAMVEHAQPLILIEHELIAAAGDTQ
jgi:acetyl-CoA carboxylase biotin carboxyl carrier protein